MTRLAWDAEGERRFEAGLDRGVLYVDSVGYVWNGLISVNESTTGGESQPYYIDGIKYLNIPGNEEFAATIEAYTYPDEFSACEGTAGIANGLYATQQRRTGFGMTYRTMLGNDTEGTDYGYKIHIVYNALVDPSEKTYGSFQETLEPLNFSWSITTTPIDIPEIKPTAHFEIDSRETPSILLNFVEEILYGNNEQDARLPSAAELIDLFFLYELTEIDGGPADNELFEREYDGGYPDSTHIQTIDAGFAE